MEFSVVSPAVMTVGPFVAIATIVCPFPSSTLLPTPLFSLPLLSATVIVCSGRQLLPPLLPTPSLVIAELVDALSEDLSDKLSLTRDTQHVIELVSKVNLLDLPHHRMDPITPIELKEQVDDLSLENK